MNGPLPLHALLSQAWVAYAIEFDNEFEHRMPHRTTRHGSTNGSRQTPWLGSMALWFNCMRFLTDGAIPVRDLERLAQMNTNLRGMQRWGYVRVKDALISPTLAGKQAQKIWVTLLREIEQHWIDRFGRRHIDELRRALQDLVEQLEVQLPDCMPILGYGLFSNACTVRKGREERADDLPLPALLAKPLLAFTLQFERESGVSLAICANVLRLTGRDGIRMRNLPREAAVSKEAIATAAGWLQRHGYAIVQTAPGSREKAIVLTPKGLKAREAYLQRVEAIEKAWQRRFGEDLIDDVRAGLEPIAAAQRPKPYPDGWRAAADRNTSLPHQPMVLHRGAYPDGA